MYKIMIKDMRTGEERWEYGFTHWMMKRIYFLLNEQDDYTYERYYEIIWCEKLYPTWKVFKKCLTNYKKVV